MNKYQESLNYIGSFVASIRQRGCGKSNHLIKIADSLLSLQELIDNYSKLQKAFDEACEWIEENKGFYKSVDKEIIKQIMFEESEKE